MNLEIPIKACHTCWTSYTLSDFCELKPAELGEPDPTIEVRRCTCGTALRLNLLGLDDLELTVSPERYAAFRPDSEAMVPQIERMLRMPERRRSRWSALAIVVSVVGLSLHLLATLMGWW